MFSFILSTGQSTKYGPRQLSRYSNSPRADRSGDRIPVGARFSAPVQNGPGAYPSSYTMGTGSFPGVMWPGRGVNHPLPSSAYVAYSRVNFTFTFAVHKVSDIPPSGTFILLLKFSCDSKFVYVDSPSVVGR